MGQSKCAIDGCGNLPGGLSHGTLCPDHFAEFIDSPEGKHAAWALQEASTAEVADAIEGTMLGDFVRRLEAEKRNGS